MKPARRARGSRAPAACSRDERVCSDEAGCRLKSRIKGRAMIKPRGGLTLNIMAMIQQRGGPTGKEP